MAGTPSTEGPAALGSQLPVPVHEWGGSGPVTTASATPPPAEIAAPATPRPLQRLQLPVLAAAGTTSSTWADPAAAALSTGLATRDADGSVVFRTPEYLYPSAPAAPEPVQRQPAADAAAPVPPAAVAGAGAGDIEHVEELAKRVYDRISERLKSELRLDRERSGRLTDLSR
jgi:hypothetical protein